MMSATSVLRRARRFLRDRSGNSAILFGLSAVPLIAGAGLATDAGVASLVQARMARALDSAGLAAARVATSDRAEADARRYFDANFPPGFMSSTITGFTYVPDASGELITITASARVPTLLMNVLGHDSMTVTATTVVERQNRGLELALAMDNTGSMRSGGKIDDMKSAATELVNILFGDDATKQHLWVSLVPFVANVNVGAGRTGWLRAGDRALTTPSGFAPTDWKGCVMARGAGRDETDDPPSVAGFDSFFWAPASDNDWDPADPGSIDDSNGAQNNGTGPNLGCGPAITPLTNVRQTLIDDIAQMLPWHRGGTTSNLGLAWAWRALSPRWRGLWDGPTPETMPLDHSDPLMDKAVVLLTDGDNQFYDWPGDGSGPDGSDFTAYGRLHDLGFTSLGAGKTELDARMLRMCQRMKDEDIIIYTITFGGSPNSATQQLFRDCATEPGNYFHAPDGATLSAAFRSIGQRLSNLRIVR